MPPLESWQMRISQAAIAVAIMASAAMPAWCQGKVWAIVVGIDEYVKPSIPKLRYAVADAKLFAQALQDTMKVPAENIFLMTSDSVDENSLPRVVNLAYRLGWLSEKVKREDTVIFFFAGHGTTMEGQPYLLTEEADNRSGMTLKVSALNGGDVIGTLRKAKTNNVWVVLDACRNSPSSKEEARLDDTISGSFSHADVGMERTATMFSCKVGERSWEWDEVKHGCYTYYLVDGLRRQAADSAGRVTLQGLANYVSEQVPKATQKLGSSQTPTMFFGGLAADKWVLASVAPPTTTASAPKGAGGDVARYVAQLDVLQAKLDKETALRVAAEQRANLAESQGRELEQRVAAMEKQVSGATGLPPGPVAYAGRGVESLEQEVNKLKAENSSLSQRLTDLQNTLAKVSSRDVQLSQEWNTAQAESSRLVAEAASRPPQEQRSLFQQALLAQKQQFDWLQKNYAASLAEKKQPPRVAQEIQLLLDGAELARQSASTAQSHLAAAEMALKEAEQRIAVLETRLQELQAKNTALTAKMVLMETTLQGSQVELQATRQQWQDSEEERAKVEDKYQSLRESLGMGNDYWKAKRRARFETFWEMQIPNQPSEFPKK